MRADRPRAGPCQRLLLTSVMFKYDRDAVDSRDEAASRFAIEALRIFKRCIDQRLSPSGLSRTI